MSIAKLTYPLASDLAVLFAVPIPHLRPFPLKALRCTMKQDTMQDGAEAAAFAFALYMAVHAAFNNPKKSGSIKVTSMSVRTTNECLYIRWNTAPSAVNIKRTIKLFAEVISRPALYKPAFYNNIALLGETTDYKQFFGQALQTQVFNHLFNAMLKNLRAGKFDFVCVSKTSADQAFLSTLTGTVKETFARAKLLEDGKAPAKHECTIPMSAHFKCPGWGAIVAVQYLESLPIGAPVAVHDQAVEVYTSDPKLTAKLIKLATNPHKVAGYLAGLAKTKDLAAWLMYKGIVSDVADIDMLATLAKEVPAIEQVQSKLKQILGGEFFKHK